MNTKSTTIALCVLLTTFAGACKFLVQQIVDYTESWKSGLPKSRGSLAGGLQSGDWVYYYESGKPRAKGGYKNDRQVGPWTFYYESGVVERSGAYDDKGLRTGEWTLQYPDQTLQARGRFVADFEDGPWQFFAANGAIERAGQYDAGKLSGPWSYSYSGGKPRARGIYFRGDKIGGWQMWDESGQERTQDLGSKPGAQIVRDAWPNGVTKREGVLANGAPVGRWTTFHDNGQLRFCCALAGSVASGVFEAHDADGNVIAQGVLDKGAFGAGCIAVVAGQTREIAAGPFAAAGDAQPWADKGALAALAPEAAVGLLVAEANGAVAPTAVVAAPVATTTPTAEATALVKKLDDEPTRAPAQAQPELSVKQREEMQSYVDTYTDGPKPGSSNLLEKYRTSSRPNMPKPQGTGELKEWYGKELPFQSIKSVDGKDVDLRQYRGKKKVMIVVLRGFLGEVCCYCVAQTKALAQSRDRLEQLGVEVLVIYPGARENEQSFEQAYKATFNEGGPPYRVFYDPNLELVTQLGIEGDLASPSTILLDKEGRIQFFYKGEHRADRPAAKKLIQFIEEMK
jgi:antitoxin component YwqK of YwqJK toxin-antitoxin module/peroxiredoxin